MEEQLLVASKVKNKSSNMCALFIAHQYNPTHSSLIIKNRIGF